MLQKQLSNKARYRVIGLMSGTSLDGLDIAYCVFHKANSRWRYSVEKFQTVKYSRRWLDRLSEAHMVSGEDLMALDAAFGAYLGRSVRIFIDRHNLRPDFIASHGHTVFHQPALGFTTQIGNGYSLQAASRLPVICDFRSGDVALGGEGAPLVPAGDKLLFHEYDVCLNLGGIANLSLDLKGQRIAFDICFCNMGLNLLAAEAGKLMDRNGAMAASGVVDNKLLKRLDKLYGRLRGRRPSLGREIFESSVRELINDSRITLEDRLCTFVESTAAEICRAVFSYKKSAKVLCTGGGALNAYLISRLLQHGGDRLTFILPEAEVIKFKEALVFAFLGVLRVRNEINCLKSVTHASSDSSAGTMIGF